MPARRNPAEVTCAALLLAYLFWLPLPFGSTTERAQPALVLPALVLCAAAAMLRVLLSEAKDPLGNGAGGPSPSARLPVILSEAKDPLRNSAGGPSPSARLRMTRRIWGAGAVLFIAVVAFQLVPLPDALLGALSPESLRLWSAAERVATLAGTGPAAAAHPISVDPSTTAEHLFRLLAYAATFFAATLLLGRPRRRMALAMVLGGAAVFEALYGVREAALRRYAVWGWVNKVIFNRVTGTFVNPNHFAHYAAIILPLGVYVSMTAWHDAAPAGVPARRRLVRVVETRLVRFGCGIVIAFACLVAILVAQSRGALLATVAGLAIAGAIASGRRHAVARGVLIAVAALGAAAIVVAYLQLPLGHFEDVSELSGARGRMAAVKTAFELWKRFPLFGSGLGTFIEVSSMTAIGGADVLINHAHDDYAEVAATAGMVGLTVALVPLLAGCAALARTLFGPAAAELSWSRRAFATAALTSLAIALAHALIDFNFFIPANPATLAAIAGAAVAIRDRR